MSVNVYYNGLVQGAKKPRLRQMRVDTDDHEMAICEVMAMLHRNMEVYYKPVLACVRGGKA